MALVLIADDHGDTIAILSAEIEAEGHTIATVTNGSDAIQCVLTELPEIVFLGPYLPIHDGYETCSMLRGDPDVPERLPIIMLGDTDLDHRRLERAGFTTSFPRQHGASDVRELLTRHLNA
ncbi:MAG: response regulator [Candidatus Hydrogenedentes bacterium]|nr:response regulator [Candidatus Hydrogenedentota bacterium]